MDFLRSLDDRLLFDMNNFARSTVWLHGILSAYAKYGVALFAGLLIAGLVIARGAKAERLAAAAGHAWQRCSPWR